MKRAPRRGSVAGVRPTILPRTLRCKRKLLRRRYRTHQQRFITRRGTVYLLYMGNRSGHRPLRVQARAEDVVPDVEWTPPARCKPEVWFRRDWSAYVDPGQGTVSGGFVRIARKDTDGGRHEERGQYYQPNRLLMLVHRITPSEQRGQLCDILIYLVPHPTSNATSSGCQEDRILLRQKLGPKRICFR